MTLDTLKDVSAVTGGVLSLILFAWRIYDAYKIPPRVIVQYLGDSGEGMIYPERGQNRHEITPRQIATRKVRFVNRGKDTTQVISVTAFGLEKLHGRWERMPAIRFDVQDSQGQKPPITLKSNEAWTCYLATENTFVALTSFEMLEIKVVCSHKDKPVIRRFKTK
jgi:hypothetical protein